MNKNFTEDSSEMEHLRKNPCRNSGNITSGILQGIPGDIIEGVPGRFLENINGEILWWNFLEQTFEDNH